MSKKINHTLSSLSLSLTSISIHTFCSYVPQLSYTDDSFILFLLHLSISCCFGQRTHFSFCLWTQVTSIIWTLASISIHFHYHSFSKTQPNHFIPTSPISYMAQQVCISYNLFIFFCFFCVYVFYGGCRKKGGLLDWDYWMEELSL